MTRVASDVIVIGGGIMGASTAFFLRQRGLSVTLLERGLVGQQASGVNFGNVRRQGRFLPQLPLANRSRAVWGRLNELLGEDAEFIATGHIRVCFRAHEADELEAHAQAVKEYGLELEMLTANELRSRYPWLAPGVVAASLSPLDGHANPRLAAPAFGRAATRAGARVVENAEVIAIEKVGEDFHVDTPTGQYCAPLVQVSAGVWGNDLSSRFGEPVPIVAKGPQMGVTEPMPYRITPVVGVYSHVEGEGIYFRQVKRGNIVWGGGWRGPAHADTLRAYIDPTVTLRQLPMLRRVAPALGALRSIRTWSGIEGYLPDDIPIMGPSGKVPGLFYAFGFCGHGFQLGPGVGETMAELMATGETSIPLAPFSITRFAAKPAP